MQDSTASPEQVLEAARDFTHRRAELWRDVYLEHMTIHDRGETWADVTEGNRWPIGLVWERLRYDWSKPDVLTGQEGGWKTLAVNGAHSANIGLAYGALDPATPP